MLAKKSAIPCNDIIACQKLILNSIFFYFPLFRDESQISFPREFAESNFKQNWNQRNKRLRKTALTDIFTTVG